MKLTTILTSTALIAGLGTAAYAEAHMTKENMIRTRDITGGNIYTMATPDTAWGDNMSYDAVGDNWNDIGEIEDIILSKDGKMIGIVAEVGGFLDIGDKHVLIPVENVRLTAVDDKTYGYVTNMTEEQLEALESVDEGFWD